ncbi:hypothetical protein S7711_08528 [Stachybotrys chartarum IBT 7711]|uniref:Uncharacterized protein n=1 Tax=Stachybotrys chartarum (strain CBS 109288 / IBT 7711) TaxID=1280523 RepID=A0A084AZU9_STACB|nr:hypothetical protein S7711_08528 [Stachybotrys chartarum IBT 7711]KFA51403.1 hypothetical protein S40293_03248 [Stachybotrys chartarum IBT 40293]KFA79217.1 hypothetical protein S40288_02339 [Stachybotrys chartarum IBT 40288]
MSSNFQGKTVAITGAAGGLGKAIAKAFLDAGANVAICDVNQERLNTTEAEWRDAYASRVLAVLIDITNEEAVNSFVKKITETYGRVDILINNAGVMDSFDPVATTTKSTWDRVIGINLTGAFLATKAAVSAMLAQEEDRGGVILTIGSNASVRGTQAGAAYTASKHALVGLSRNTAGFHGPQGVYSVVLLLGAMGGTNVQDSFRVTGLNMEGMGRMREMNPGMVEGQTDVLLEDVARFCLFYGEKRVAEIANGSCVGVNKNWPVA